MMGLKMQQLYTVLSQTSKNGGDLGWINENSINKIILENISTLKIE